MGVIVFNGVSSADYGIVVEHFPDTSMPKEIMAKRTLPDVMEILLRTLMILSETLSEIMTWLLPIKNIDFGNSQIGFPISAMQGLDIAGWKTAMIRSTTEWQCLTSPGISRIF